MKLRKPCSPGATEVAGLPLAACLLVLTACATQSTTTSNTSVSVPGVPSVSSPGLPSSSPSTPRTTGASRPASTASATGAASGTRGSTQDAGQSGLSGQQKAAQTAEAAKSPASSKSLAGAAVEGEDAAAQTEEGAAGGRGTGPAKNDDEILSEALEQFGRTGVTEADVQEGNAGQLEGAEGAESGTALPQAVARAQSAPAADGVAGQGSQTDAEKSRRLEQELQRQFGEFDELMMKERQALARQRSEGGSAESTYGESAGESTAAGGEQMPQTAMAEGGTMQGAASSRTGVSGTGKGDIPTNAPPDVGSGEDDDIIARQLREAAMKEEDPALREKLWDEYRKYKRGA